MKFLMAMALIISIFSQVIATTPPSESKTGSLDGIKENKPQDELTSERSVGCSKALFSPSASTGTWQEALNICASHDALLPQAVDVSVQEQLDQMGAVSNGQHVWLGLEVVEKKVLFTESHEQFHGDQNVLLEMKRFDQFEPNGNNRLGIKAKSTGAGCYWFRVNLWDKPGNIVCQEKCSESSFRKAYQAPFPTSGWPESYSRTRLTYKKLFHLLQQADNIK